MKGTIGCCLAILMTAASARAELPPLVDRAEFISDPEISYATFSPDGRTMTFLKLWKDVRNVWIKKRTEPFAKARPLTAETRTVAAHRWSRDSKYVLYERDTGGDENYHIYAVDPNAKGDPVPAARDLTPLPKVRAYIIAAPLKTPNEIIVGINDRDPKMHDVYRIDLTTAERTLLWKNTDNVYAWQTDLDGKLRLGVRQTRDGGHEILKVVGDALVPIYAVNADEEVRLFRFTPDGNRFYFASNKGDADKLQLMLFDLTSAEVKVVDKDPKDETDIAEAIFSDVTNELVATVYVGDRRRVYFPPSTLQRTFEKMKRQLPDVNLHLGDRTADERWWLLYVQDDNEKGSYYAFDRKSGKVEYVRNAQPGFPSRHLPHMQVLRYKARDGMEIPAYLVLPKGLPAKGLPAIVMPHGGPWARDQWGYHALAQLLANRGYAVLLPNFRGSAGYGKKFRSAGDKQWGTGVMQHDVSDGVHYLVQQGIADPKRIGIAGWSYGGYATLAGLAFTPELYAAGFDAVGPSNLITLLDSIPPYWETAREMFNRRVGDPGKPEERKLLMAKSPVNSVANIRAPLFVAQGANDPRVKQAESDQIVAALRDRGRSVEYVIVPDEGHWFEGRESRIAVFVAMERFFGKHLGGRVQQEVPAAIQQRLDAMTVNIKDVVASPAGEGQRKAAPPAAPSPAR
jgi:dipeptidyl aminopeptidase/acylaminoacyl peptidase